MTDRKSGDTAAEMRRRLLSPLLSTQEFAPLSSTVRLEVGAATRCGGRQRQNEDQYLVVKVGRQQETLLSSLAEGDLPNRFEEHGYGMLVADGAGTSGAGGLASRIAVSTLAHLLLHFGKWSLRIDDQIAGEVLERAEMFYQSVATAVEHKSRTSPVLAGMCTTLTAAFSAGSDLFLAHVGHSRAYLLRDGRLTQLTRDHTVEQRVAESGQTMPMPVVAQDLRHILTDAIGGPGGPPLVDLERFTLSDGDCILLCTDGLTNVVDDETIANLLSQPRRTSEQCQALIDQAVQNGGEDDTTVVLAQYRIPPPTRP
jgi:protein phosphatase